MIDFGVLVLLKEFIVCVFWFIKLIKKNYFKSVFILKEFMRDINIIFDLIYCKCFFNINFLYGIYMYNIIFNVRYFLKVLRINVK